MELRSHLKQQRELLTIKPINTGNRRKLKVNEINNLDSRIYPIWPIKEKQAACYEVLGNWKCKLKKKSWNRISSQENTLQKEMENLTEKLKGHEDRYLSFNICIK